MSFYDASVVDWVKWAPGLDTPPMPPGWSLLGVPTKVPRPAWRSRWRMIPVALVVGAVVVEVVQAVAPSSNNTAKEAAASRSLLGTCLARDGT
ncbi:MAG: hypothetical protein JO337_03595, partial [Acidimicrobiales bacterium]|nr:hypothetical protein [Acidimicrobiales bacterium]